MKKNKKKIIIILVSIILLIGIGITLFLVFFNKGNDESVDIKPIDAEAYFKENGEIVSVIDANDSTDVTTEKESMELFTDRGFTEYPITTNYSMDGKYSDEKEIEESSAEKHPMFTTYYVCESGDLWTIELVNGCITAYPVSYNEQSESEVPVIISETDTTYSYDSITNKFYETIPKDTALIVKKIDRIDSASLESLTKEGIDKL